MIEKEGELIKTSTEFKEKYDGYPNMPELKHLTDAQVGSSVTDVAI